MGGVSKMRICKGVKFSKTKFFDVDLSEALELTQAQIDEACVDEKTKLPVGLKLPDPCPTTKP
jgi:hypothetical protein